MDKKTIESLAVIDTSIGDSKVVGVRMSKKVLKKLEDKGIDPVKSARNFLNRLAE